MRFYTLNIVVEDDPERYRGRAAGSNIVAAKLADLLFMQSLSVYLASGVQNSVGWMRVIMNPLVGRAISSMHAAPGTPLDCEYLRQRQAAQDLSLRSYIVHW